MLTNAYLLANIGADTAENEQHSAEILPIGRRVAREMITRYETLLAKMDAKDADSQTPPAKKDASADYSAGPGGPPGERPPVLDDVAPRVRRRWG